MNGGLTGLTTWGWVINDIIFIFGWTNPLIFCKVCFIMWSQNNMQLHPWRFQEQIQVSSKWSDRTELNLFNQMQSKNSTKVLQFEITDFYFNKFINVIVSW